jgi:hypothetical protein
MEAQAFVPVQSFPCVAPNAPAKHRGENGREFPGELASGLSETVKTLIAVRCEGLDLCIADWRAVFLCLLRRVAGNALGLARLRQYSFARPERRHN